MEIKERERERKSRFEEQIKEVRIFLKQGIQNNKITERGQENNKNEREVVNSEAKITLYLLTNITLILFDPLFFSHLDVVNKTFPLQYHTILIPY